MKPVFIVFAFILIAFSACRKSEQVSAPDVVQSALTAKFPAARAVDWSMEADGQYEAEFKVEGQQLSAVFDAAGNWLETETKMTAEGLPEAVRQAIAAQFPDYKLEEIESVETPEGQRFEVSLEKGEEELEVVFAPDGTILKQDMETEDEDGDAQEK